MQSVENSSGRFDIREARLIRKAIAALRFSDYKDPITLLKGVFLIAFSEELRLLGSVREILDSLGSSDESPEIKFIKETVVNCTSPSDGLSVADVAFTEDNNGFGVFVFDGEWVIDLTNGFARLDTSEFLKVYQEVKRKAILRPSLVLHGCPECEGYVNETLTEAQHLLKRRMHTLCAVITASMTIQDLHGSAEENFAGKYQKKSLRIIPRQDSDT